METGLLNFHDEETFATSLYDQGDFSGVDGQNSLLDMMHSDLQYSSDYLNQSAVHWDSDQEQEHNGDLAVLPVAPSECSSLNSSREDYHKSLFEWQDSLLPYQPLDPDGVDLRLDGQAIPSELPDNIFEDSFESNSSVASSILKPSLPDPPARSSTPVAQPCPKESAASPDASLNLDMSLSGLDVNVSDIDVSALGINVSSLEIKSDNNGDISEAKPHVSLDDTGQPAGNVSMQTEELLQPANMPSSKSELVAVDDHEFTALFGARESSSNPLVPSIPTLNGVQLPVPKIENPEDVEQLHDIAMEFIKEEQEAQAWDGLPLLDAPLDCNVDLDSITAEVPVLEAGNLESLLEQFEALKPAPEFSQSMPASPAHFSVPPSPLSMPASPSCIPLSTHTPLPLVSKTSPLPSPSPSPSKSKSEASTPKKASPSKGVSLLHQNILEALPAEIMDRIKASGRKKTIPVIPAMPSKKAVRSGTRMQAAGAALSRNKLLKLVSRNGSGGENVQFDHDYCSSDSMNNVEFIPEKLVEDIKASTKMMEYEEDRASRKDSGLESGDVSEDSEGAGAAVSSGVNSGHESGSGGPKVAYNSILKPRSSNPTGQNKEKLMVSVLKKVRCDASKTPPKPQTLLRQLPPQPSPGRPNVKCVKSNQAMTCNVKPLSRTPQPLEPPLKPVCSSNLTEAVVKQTVSGSKPLVTPGKLPETVPLKSVKIPIESAPKEAKLAGTKLKPASLDVKTEPTEIIELSHEPSGASDSISENAASVKQPEQPRKRKLNLEEYRSRQKALEQKREEKKTCDTVKDISDKSCAGEVMLLAPTDNVCSPPILVKMEPETMEDNVSENTVPSLEPTNSVKEGEKTELTPEIVCQPSKVSVEEVNEQELGLDNDDSANPGVVKDKKAAEVLCKAGDSCSSPTIVKTERDSESVTVEIQEDVDDQTKPVEEKKKQRQYRTRRISTSSSEGSPQSKKVSVLSVKRENVQRKVNVFPSKPKSRSPSVSSSRSRSASSNGSRSSRSSSSDSSSSSGSVRSNRRKRATRRRRSGRSSCSRGRSSSSCSGSSRSSSRSSRRSNSMSSGYSRRSGRRASHSRRRSRSRSTRRSRSRRDRSLSRGSSGWRHWRRDSSRSRSRRDRGRCRNRSRESWSSCDRSWSGSRSRSHSSCRRRNTSRLRSDARSHAGRRLYSYSSRSESRSMSRSVSRSMARSRSSSSRSRSYSSGSDRSRSRSWSRGRKRARAKTQRNSKRKKLRSRSPMRRSVDWTHVEKEHNRQVEERRVIYVGRIPEETTKAELRKRFEMFGPIVDISLHFREHADNYGFVTFAYQIDAYNAVERGNNDPNLPRYELCFGGRRKFCRERYADLDGMACKNGMGANLPPHMARNGGGNSFDDMLREVQAKLQARKKL